MWHCTTWHGTAARQLTSGTQLGAVIYPHTHILTHGRRRHSRGRAQSCCVSVGLMWSFGAIIKPRMNAFDCRRQITGTDTTAAGMPPLSSFDLSAMLCHVCLWSVSVSVSVKDKKSVYRYWLKMMYRLTVIKSYTVIFTTATTVVCSKKYHHRLSCNLVAP